jgi:hypothetical protein
MAAKSKLRTESEFEGYRRQRVSDLRRLFRDRYGLQFPDDDAGLIDLKELLCPISLGGRGQRPPRSLPSSRKWQSRSRGQ